MSIKIAYVGAGSFVFGPSVLHDLIVVHRLAGAELVLIDKDREMATLMQGVGEALSRTAGVPVTIRVDTEFQQALDGADFVICSAAAQLKRRFAMDCQIINGIDPKHLITEFGGLAGIAYSLRQIRLIEELAVQMRARCPSAWLLIASNPLPRVAQAAHELGIKTAGFCCNSLGGYGVIAQVLDEQTEHYPWTQTMARYDAIMAGVNHLTFATSIKNRQTGAEMLPELISRIRSRDLLRDKPITRDLAMQTGCLPANGDDHMHDFLPPYPGDEPLHETSHGNSGEREERMQRLQRVASGKESPEQLLRHRAWEHPMDFAAALSGGRPATFPSLNLVNTGQIPELPKGAFVETPATADAQGVHPRHCPLPERVAELSRQTAAITDVIVKAALRRSKSLVHQAVDLDPTIVDKRLGHLAMDELLAAHEDLLERYV